MPACTSGRSSGQHKGKSTVTLMLCGLLSLSGRSEGREGQRDRRGLEQQLLKRHDAHAVAGRRAHPSSASLRRPRTRQRGHSGHHLGARPEASARRAQEAPVHIGAHDGDRERAERTEHEDEQQGAHYLQRHQCPNSRAHLLQRVLRGLITAPYDRHRPARRPTRVLLVQVPTTQLRVVLSMLCYAAIVYSYSYSNSYSYFYHSSRKQDRRHTGSCCAAGAHFFHLHTKPCGRSRQLW